MVNLEHVIAGWYVFFSGIVIHRDLKNSVQNSSFQRYLNGINDQKCFLWSVLAGIHPSLGTSLKITKYLQCTDELIMNGIKYPVKDITKFKKQNSPQVSVNLSDYEENNVYLFCLSENIKTRRLNLLYITEGENGYITIS